MNGLCFVILASVAEALAEQNPGNQENIAIQQGGQTVYPAHVQYVEGNDPSIYASTNGQMYELTWLEVVLMRVDIVMQCPFLKKAWLPSLQYLSHIPGLNIWLLLPVYGELIGRWYS